MPGTEYSQQFRPYLGECSNEVSQVDGYKKVEIMLRSMTNERLKTLPVDRSVRFLVPFPVSTAEYDPPSIVEHCRKNSTATAIDQVPSLVQEDDRKTPLQMIGFLPCRTCRTSSVSDGTQVLGWLPQFGGSFHDIDQSLQSFGSLELSPCKPVPIIGFEHCPGAIYLPGYLSFDDQLALANECLRQYINLPNQSNISRLRSTDTSCLSAPSDSVPRNSFWPEAAPVNSSSLQDSLTYQPTVRQERFELLRWVTLGHQYNWSSRTYDGYEPFPQPLRQLAVQVVTAIVKALSGITEDHNRCVVTDEIDSCALCNSIGNRELISYLIDAVVNAWSVQTINADGGGGKRCFMDINLKEYQPDCAILNLYRGSDRLRGHVDDVEPNSTLPLVSISLGEPCLFLLGGESREKSPLPCCLRSGDVLVLGGPARLVYHGVPRLLSFEQDVSVKSETREMRKKNTHTQPVTRTMGVQKEVQMTRQVCCSSEMRKLLNFEEIVEQFRLGVDTEHRDRIVTRKTEIEETASELVRTLQACRLNISIRQVITKPIIRDMMTSFSVPKIKVTKC